MGESKKSKKAARDEIANAGALPVWAGREAINYIEKNRDRLNFDSRPARKYYVIYALHGEAACNRRRGIYATWDEPGGANEQLTGCANKFTTASTFTLAEDLLFQGIAMEFRDGYLPRVLHQDQPQSTSSKNAGPARRPRESGDESDDEDASRKRPRIHSSGSQSSAEPDRSQGFFIDLTGEKQQRDVIPLTEADQEPKIPAAPSAAPPVELPAAEFPLCPEQKHALELALLGHNLFITGSGGCGKSVLVGSLNDNLVARKKTVHLVAPTGQAATNVGGRTTYSYAGWTPNSLQETNRTLIRQAQRSRSWDRLTHTDVLIIDEISMVDRQFFETMSTILSAVRKDTRPFGGVQVIAVGDFCQLPPVLPFKFCYEEIEYRSEGSVSVPCGPMERSAGKYTCKTEGHPQFEDSDKWAFQSPVWQECNFRYIHLTKIHRQKDKEFVEMLQHIRMGLCVDKELNVLLQQRNVEDGIFLFADKKAVKAHNGRELDKLKHRPQAYTCVDSGQSRGDDQRFEERLVLKEAMPVVLLANIDVEAGLCNGSQGKIVAFVPLKPEEEPSEPKKKNYKGDDLAYEIAMEKFHQVNAFKGRHKLYPEVQFSKGQTCVIRPECSVFNIEGFMKEVEEQARADASG
ncbi:ATP-dependent dna helicase pif1 [Colletotrichum sojae]|uniref:ATP-dependent DNA helicase n=1 Tax=Colletotrichum sojae TaxID=2175907 RepID=A0A8H6MU93_9PEZI|nr:ATP-dependent dna helicase pif1 [Colletotrichum sojae]